MSQLSERLVLGFEVVKEVPTVLRPLVDAVVECYKRHHPDLQAIFIIGSVAIGEWTKGISDLDVVGVVARAFTLEDETPRRRELLLLDTSWRHQVSFINNSTLSMEMLHTETPGIMTLGRARIIAVCGLQIWGKELDFREYLPTVETMARERTARAKIVLGRYRAGTINEPFRSNPRLLTRSCAKAAIRVISSITILRGAVFYASPQRTVEMVPEYAPEATHLANRAITLINGAEAEIDEALEITNGTIALFYRLYPSLQQM